MAALIGSLAHRVHLPLSASPSRFTNMASAAAPITVSPRRAPAASFSAQTTAPGSGRRLPVLLFDIMDTIVRDPFYEDIPAFFGMSLKELIECKHPTVWIEFEKGLIDEVELARRFFKDGRSFDLEGLKVCMRNSYSCIDGIEELLHDLKEANYEMHAFTNYPIWYQIIEDKLQISRFLSWTFCSCTVGKRKPDPDFYLDAVRHLEVDPSNCIFIDDRLKNAEAASEVGIVGLQFKSVDLLRKDLSRLGVDIPMKGQLVGEERES